MPFTALLQGEAPSGLFKEPKELRDVFEKAGADLERPLICSCGSGATAAVVAHAIALAKETSQGPPSTVRLRCAWPQRSGLVVISIVRFTYESLKPCTS